MTPVRLCVFGGLRMWRSGTEVAIGSARVRTVLAVLIAARGATVSRAELVDTVWGDRPSGSAVNQVQRLIGQVRRLFEPELPNRETGEWLLPVGAGYRLRQDAQTSDLMAFFALADARRELDQALTLAQDQPFAGLPADVLSLPRFTAIEAARTQVAVHAADLALSDAGADRLLPLLIPYAEAAPFHEPLQARLIRLLTAAGRRPEALTRFETVRQRLADDLGADPGAELRAAHRDALAEPNRPDRSRPAQLPLRVAAFSPRDDLTAALEAGRSKGVVVLSGMGGAGKTTLAVDWAHRIAADFPDGQLYLDLRGFDPSGRQLRPAEALTTLLRSMGAAAPGSDDPDVLGARFRSLVATRRMVVVLDNARDSAQVRPLLPGAPGCLAVITSRNRMPGLVAREGAWPVHVGRLSPRAAADMLARRLGTRRIDAEPAATDRLVEICAGLPLALSIAAARIAVSPQETLTDVVTDLASPGHRLDVLDTGEEHDSVRSAFSWSYAVLSEPAKRLFRLLAVYPSPVVSADTAASIAGADVRAELTELSVTNMFTPLSAGRYTAHDLLQEYAAELLDDQDDRGRAERRLVEHYLHASGNAYLTFQVLPPADLGPPPPGVFPPRPADVTAAHAWYGRERAAVRAVTELALLRGWARSAALILIQVRPMRSSQPEPTAEIRRQAKRAVDAVAELGDPELETLMLREASILERPHAPDLARAYLERALAIAERRGDLGGQAQILRNLARSEFASGARLLRYGQRAVAAARGSGEASVLVYALLWLAIILEEESGDLAAAAVAADEAFELAGAAGMDDARCTVATQRASIALEAGDNEAAIRMAQWALDHGTPADEINMYFANVVMLQACQRSGATAAGRAAAQWLRALVRGRETVFAEATRPDLFARNMATADAMLAGVVTADDSQ